MGGQDTGLAEVFKERNFKNVERFPQLEKVLRLKPSQRLFRAIHLSTDDSKGVADELQQLLLTYKSVLRRKPNSKASLEFPPALLRSLRGQLPCRRMACRILLRISERFPSCALDTMKHMLELVKISLPNAFMSPGVVQEYELEIALESLQSINSALSASGEIPAVLAIDIACSYLNFWGRAIMNQNHGGHRAAIEKLTAYGLQCLIRSQPYQILDICFMVRRFIRLAQYLRLL